MADSYGHLAKFPSNGEITHKLAVAESQACKLAVFAGISPCFCSPRSSLQNPPDETPNDDVDANEGKCSILSLS
jgi:hypothetical protein